MELTKRQFSCTVAKVFIDHGSTGKASKKGGDERTQLFLKESGFRMAFPYDDLDISGNEDYGYRPYELMLASIAGCSASVFRKELDRQNMVYDDISVTVEVERNPKQANKIDKIQLQYVVKGPQLDDEKLYNNLEIARNNCSMIRSVESSIKIEQTLESIEINR